MAAEGAEVTVAPRKGGVAAVAVTEVAEVDTTGLSVDCAAWIARKVCKAWICCGRSAEVDEVAAAADATIAGPDEVATAVGVPVAVVELLVVAAVPELALERFVFTPGVAGAKDVPVAAVLAAGSVSLCMSRGELMEDVAGVASWLAAVLT